MATQTITSDFTSPVEILGTDDILIINQDVTGTINGLTAINGASVASNRQITLRGKLDVSGTGDGILLGLDSDPTGSSGGTVTLAQLSSVTVQDGYGIRAFVEDIEIVTRGSILGDGGIYSGSGGGIISNFGKIKVENSAISANTAGQQVENSGLLQSDSAPAISLLGGGNVIVSNGTIRGPDSGAAIFFAPGFGLANNVTISGNLLSDDVAYQGNDNADNLLIKGKVTGDILLGDGFNLFIVQNATITGNVLGGDDGDTYRCMGQAPKIVESNDSGFDGMECNGNAKLANHVEWLQLLGSGDIDGTGNGGDNNLDGNGGDNVLKGLGGDDFFNGGRGNDLCIGGPGSDTFLIFFDSGHDTIRGINADDALDITSFGYDSFNEARKHFHEVAGGLEFRDGRCRVVLADFDGDGLGDVVAWQP